MVQVRNGCDLSWSDSRIKRETVEIKVVYMGVVVTFNKYFRRKTEDLCPRMAPPYITNPNAFP